MSDRLEDYEFELPPELIASRPLPERDASRMLVLHRSSGTIEHRTFRDFPGYLQPRDLVVLNNSKVLKAKLVSDDRRVEMLLIEPGGERLWKCFVKPGRRMRPGSECTIGGIRVVVKAVLPDGERLVEFETQPDLDRLGAMPLPPYLRRPADEQDVTRYQTVFAGPPGSIAAPTAGLHFTPELLGRLPHASLTLHVGIGTFLPVRSSLLSSHKMHREHFAITEQAAFAINAAARLVVVGTTTARVLESQPDGPIRPQNGSTEIFIYPPFAFRRVGALLTNFHLPRSTLLMLVSAFAGRERVLDAYREAVRQRYRFFSYGDCMLIL